MCPYQIVHKVVRIDDGNRRRSIVHADSIILDPVEGVFAIEIVSAQNSPLLPEEESQCQKCKYQQNAQHNNNCQKWQGKLESFLDFLKL